MSNIYYLHVHEQCKVSGKALGEEGVTCTRVPGGWLYTILATTSNHEMSVSTCFVPYNEEFKK